MATVPTTYVYLICNLVYFLPRQQFPSFSFLYILMASLARIRLAGRLVCISEFNHQFPSYSFLPQTGIEKQTLINQLFLPATSNRYPTSSRYSDVSGCGLGSAIYYQASWRFLPFLSLRNARTWGGSHQRYFTHDVQGDADHASNGNGCWRFV